MRNPSANGRRSIPARSGTAGRQRLRLLAGLLLFMVANPLVCFAQPAVTIGGSLGLSGRFAPIADALKKGFALWEHDVNQGGGMAGRPVKVLIEDDRSDPDVARAIYRRLVENNRVDFLFAPYSSLITEAVLPIAEARGMPMLIAGAAADRLWAQGYRNAIGIYTPASKFTTGFLELLVRNGMDNLAIVYASDPFSVDLAESARKWAGRFKLTIDHMEMFDKGVSNLEAQAQRARKKGSQVLLVCGHMEEAVNMVHALKRIDWRPKALYASVGPALQAFYDRCGIAAEHVFATSLWEPSANYPGARDFNRQFIDTYLATPGYHAGLAYAAGQVLEKAVAEAGGIDHDRVRETLYRLDTMTIIGRFGIDRTGKQVRQHTFVIQWQNGRKELVWPDQIRTAEPLFE